jgi:hypothetical protein
LFTWFSIAHFSLMLQATSCTSLTWNHSCKNKSEQQHCRASTSLMPLSNEHASATELGVQLPPTWQIWSWHNGPRAATRSSA